MASFVCDNPAVKRNLLELEQLITREGGELHGAMSVVQSGPALSVMSSLSAQSKDILIKIPKRCLIDLEDLVITTSDDGASFKLDVAPADPVLAGITELVFEIFNQTDKLRYHRQSSAPFCLQYEPEIISLLQQLRPLKADQWEILGAEPEDKVLLDTFFKSRVLGDKTAENSTQRRVIMPFIDYLNHHSQATSFQSSGDSLQVDFLSVRNSKPVADNDEAFVCYARQMDAVDPFISYGFVDRLSQQFFVRSIPLVVEVPGHGTLAIQTRFPQEFAGKLGQQNQDLRSWLPLSQIGKQGELIVPHLKIPTRHSLLALRRCLGLMLRALNPGNHELREAVRYAEARIVEKNRDFYTDLLTACANPCSELTPHQVLSDLSEICNIQLQQLQHYRLMPD